MAKRLDEKPTPEPDERQLALNAGAAAAPARKPWAKALPPAQVFAMAKRAVERRGVIAGRVVLRVPVRQDAAEVLLARAIRETRNLDDLDIEILELEASAS